MSDLVGNTEDRFSHNEAQLYYFCTSFHIYLVYEEVHVLQACGGFPQLPAGYHHRYTHHAGPLYSAEKKIQLTQCMLGDFSCFLSSAVFFFKINFLKKILSGIPSKCQTVWTLIRPDNDLGQTVCQGNQQTTQADNELNRF